MQRAMNEKSPPIWSGRALLLASLLLDEEGERERGLLHKNLELRSSSFTFGRTRASSVLLSLNQDLLAINDVNASLLLGEALTCHIVDNLILGIALEGAKTRDVVIVASV